MELSQEEEQFQQNFMEKAAQFMQEIFKLVRPAPHTNGETKKRPREEEEVEEIEEEEIEKEIQKTPEKKKPVEKKPVEEKPKEPEPEPEKETKKKRAKKDPVPSSSDGVCAGRFWLNPPLPCILVEEGRSTEGIELSRAQKFPGAAGKCEICKECGKKRKNFKQSERTRKKKEQKQNEQTKVN